MTSSRKLCFMIFQRLDIILYIDVYFYFIRSTSLLQDKFFITKYLTDVKRVRWYPGSPEDNHLVVLTNNKNCLRLFKVDNGTGKLESIWRIGPQTSRILASLGDTAVDFDFAPPVLLGDRNKSETSIMWPILVLQGNGTDPYPFNDLLSHLILYFVGTIKYQPCCVRYSF